MQSKKHTWMEIGTNILIGGVGAAFITYGVLFLNLSNGWTAIVSTILCTLWSIARQYVIRRQFNKLTVKEMNRGNH